MLSFDDDDSSFRDSETFGVEETGDGSVNDNAVGIGIKVGDDNRKGGNSTLKNCEMRLIVRK